MGKKQVGFNAVGRATVILSLAVASCSLRPEKIHDSETDRLNCQKQIRSAAYCVFQYRADHDEQLPKTLEDAVSAEAGKEMAHRLIQCPAKVATAKYFYVDWSRWFTNAVVPKDYPLVYESNKSQHGDGINVARMDGSVFWDESGRWIIEFAKQHPEYGLEIPR
jgi:hypothetical protein